MLKKLENIRLNYQKYELTEELTDPNPFKQFDHWIREVLQSEQPEPTAMCLSTVAENGYPQSRIVLLKEYNEKELVFFSNYESQKGKAIALNSKVSLVFFWPIWERQVRIEGIAAKLSIEESDRYFASRPRESQLSAIVSAQSGVLSSREEIVKKYEVMKDELKDVKNVRRPVYWGGYKIIPCRFEFWQGRPFRLHDRLLYILEAGQWSRVRLAP